MEFDLPGLAIFDLDGTLIDFEHDQFYANAEKVLATMGYGHIKMDEIRTRFADHDLWGFVPEEEQQTFGDNFWEAFKLLPSAPARALAGAIETLEHFHRAGAHIAIATARSEHVHEIEEELSGTGILHYVSVVSSRGVGNPDWRDKRGQILELCAQFGVSSSASIMVGDSPIDIVSGKSARVRATIGLLSGGIRPEVMRSFEPDLLVDHVGELPVYFPK